METYRQFWAERLDNMETYLATLAPASKEEQSDE
jgi:hypothetical protein